MINIIYTMKRTILAITIFCFVFVAKAFEYGDTFKVGGIYYTVTNEKKREVKIGLVIDGYFLNSKTLGSNVHVSGDFEIPAVVTYWGEEFLVVGVNSYCFTNAKKLKHVKLPKTIKSIGHRAFECTSLSNINLPSGVTEIESCAFDGTKLRSIDLPSSITIISHGAFASTLLESIVLPPKVIEIESRAFSRCKNLRYVELNEGLEKIGWYSFEGTKILRIELPASIKNIGNFAFPKCLREIKCNAVTPPILVNLDESILNKCILWVPSQSVEAYRTDISWGKFKTIMGF